MDMGAVIGVLNDLPSTFRRPEAPYTQLIDAVAAAKTRYTIGADATLTEVLSFANQPQDGWLDTWGLLFGMPRASGESNAQYSLRIEETLLAWVGTLPAIQMWLNLFAPGGFITENSGSLGYMITFPPTMTVAQIIAFLVSLGRIRPAGVPFNVQQIGSGIYMDTDVFLGSGSRVAGDYLTTGAAFTTVPLGPTTLSTKVLLSSYWLNDPTLNP